MTEISLTCGIYSWNPATGASSVKNCIDVLDLQKVDADHKVVVYIDHSDDAVDISCRSHYGKYSFHGNREEFNRIFKVILKEVDPRFLICRHTDGCASWEATPQEVIDYMAI